MLYIRLFVEQRFTPRCHARSTSRGPTWTYIDYVIPWFSTLCGVLTGLNDTACQQICCQPSPSCNIHFTLCGMQHFLKCYYIVELPANYWTSVRVSAAYVTGSILLSILALIYTPGLLPNIRR